ncbi:MAG: hypothetical protein OEY38_23405 [Gammaproteobacteria bacterium]|nr:hypothetical protein [Gammaproteobacteria bacterium]
MKKIFIIGPLLTIGIVWLAWNQVTQSNGSDSEVRLSQDLAATTSNQSSVFSAAESDTNNARQIQVMLSQLQFELKIVKQQLAEMQNSQIMNSTTNSIDAIQQNSENPTEKILSMEELEQQQFEQAIATKDRFFSDFSAEEVDVSWASEIENRIQSHFNTLNQDQSKYISELQCRSKTCRFNVTTPTNEAAMQAEMEMLAGISPLLRGQAFVETETDETGNHKTTFIMQKPNQL